MYRRDIVVVGASAGGVEALTRLVADLPEDFPAALFVTVHFPASSTSALPSILCRAGKLGASHPENGERIEPGHIYVAPPDRHLMLYEGRVDLVRGATENGNRPAIDPMFRSAAAAYRERVVGVVLTGNLDDGTAGLQAIKRRGGITVAQDPADAAFPSMPATAISYGVIDYIVPLDEMPTLLQRLTSGEVVVRKGASVPDDATGENEYSRLDLRMHGNEEEHPGAPSTFSCPDCGGVLWEIQDGSMVRYRCRIGHAWSSDGLILQQSQMINEALSAALRSLEESAALSGQMAKRARSRRHERLAMKFEENQRAAEQRAALIRDVLLKSRRMQEVATTEQMADDIPHSASDTARD